MEHKIQYQGEKTKCPCGSRDIAYDGEFTQDLPTGVGFHQGDSRFTIDVNRYKGFVGQCWECGSKILAYKGKPRHIARHPRLKG